MTTSIALRPLAVEDASEMARVLADPQLYVFTGGEPPSREQLAQRYAVQCRGQSEDGSEKWLNELVLLGPEQPIGYVQATIPVDSDTAAIAWVIGMPWQGSGYGLRAARLFVDQLAARGVRRTIAHIHPRHEASIRIAQRLGMSPTDVDVDGETRWSGCTQQ